ncbi:hypothetical protein [Burkholderia gladioli]|uniref:hypothetical protein n=1 Tax=Burkholderia gladioli TaxID=28095 RepID=UPI0016414EB1|nr:hypothetical protein [Burkholderia gladioli]
MTDLELRLYTALKLIAKAYQTPAQIRRTSEKKYGLQYEEALEYAYENIQQEARNAIKGVRVPKPKQGDTR